MKKTIFDLSLQEGKQIDKEISKTSYFKQYVGGYIFTIIFLVFVYFIGTALYVFDNPTYQEETANVIYSIGLIIIGSAMAIGLLLFWFKKFDLIKKYYEEKYIEGKKE